MAKPTRSFDSLNRFNLSGDGCKLPSLSDTGRLFIDDGLLRYFEGGGIEIIGNMYNNPHNRDELGQLLLGVTAEVRDQLPTPLWTADGTKVPKAWINDGAFVIDYDHGVVLSISHYRERGAAREDGQGNYLPRTTQGPVYYPSPTARPMSGNPIAVTMPDPKAVRAVMPVLTEAFAPACMAYKAGCGVALHKSRYSGDALAKLETWIRNLADGLATAAAVPADDASAVWYQDLDASGIRAMATKALTRNVYVPELYLEKPRGTD